MQFSFRSATNDDVDVIVELVESAYRGDASRAGWTTEADFLDGHRTGADDVIAQIERPASRILLAVLRQAQDERGMQGVHPELVEKKKPFMVSPSTWLRTGLSNHHGELVEPRAQAGSAALLACAHVADEDGVGYFGMFSVQPGLQNTGIGKAMLAEAERIAREEWKLPAMRMTVIDIRAELIAWYERRGYRRTGILKAFPYGDARFGIPKRDDLRFEILEKIL